jgi:hypothetical protein
MTHLALLLCYVFFLDFTKLVSPQTATFHQSNNDFKMNKKQAIKQRQANQLSKKAEQEVHAADILKGNLVTSPTISQAPRNKSLEEQLITKHEETIDLQKQHIDHLAQVIENRDRIIDARDEQIVTLKGLIQEWKNMVLANEKRWSSFVEEQQEFLLNRYTEKYGKWMKEETGTYKEVIARLEGRIEELEDARGYCPESAGEKARGPNTELVDQEASTIREGKQKGVGNERGRQRKMEAGTCVVS